MSIFKGIFRRKPPFSLPEFNQRVDELRPYLREMDVEKKIKTLIDVSKVWTYEYDERKGFMQEVFDTLPEGTQSSMVEFLSDCLPDQEVSQDIPLALSQIEKEKLDEFITLNPTALTS